MRLIRGALAGACLILVCAVATVAVLGRDDAPQRVRSLGAETRSAAPTTAPPPGSPIVGLSPAELKAVVEAPGPAHRSVTPVSVGVDVVRVPTVAGDPGARAAGREVARILIFGSHPVRAIGASVFLDGRPVGPGLLTSDGSALVAVLTDSSLAKPGAVVTYRYGSAPPTLAGGLPAGR